MESVFPSIEETVKQVRAEYNLDKESDCCRLAMCVFAKITIDNIVKEMIDASKIKVVADPLQRFDYKSMIMSHLSAFGFGCQKLNKYVKELQEKETVTEKDKE